MNKLKTKFSSRPSDQILPAKASSTHGKLNYSSVIKKNLYFVIKNATVHTVA